MTDEDRQRFRSLIEQTLAELEGRTAFLDDETQPIAPSIAIGRLSRMEAINEKSIIEESKRKNATRLLGLKNALIRIDQGTYGRCLKCGREIPEERLQVIPESVLCVACKEKG